MEPIFKESIFMRISPIFAQTGRTASTTMGQAFQQRTNCRKPHSSASNSAYDKSDVFMRLAEASMRDAKIEHELKSMGLI